MLYIYKCLLERHTYTQEQPTYKGTIIAVFVIYASLYRLEMSFGYGYGAPSPYPPGLAFATGPSLGALPSQIGRAAKIRYTLHGPDQTIAHQIVHSADEVGPWATKPNPYRDLDMYG